MWIDRVRVRVSHDWQPVSLNLTVCCTFGDLFALCFPLCFENHPQISAYYTYALFHHLVFVIWRFADQLWLCQSGVQILLRS